MKQITYKFKYILASKSFFKEVQNYLSIKKQKTCNKLTWWIKMNEKISQQGLCLQYNEQLFQATMIFDDVQKKHIMFGQAWNNRYKIQS